VSWNKFQTAERAGVAPEKAKQQKLQHWFHCSMCLWRQDLAGLVNTDVLVATGFSWLGEED
jgi:hypothetical protein